VTINYGKVSNDEMSSVESYLIYDYDWFNTTSSRMDSHFKVNNSESSLNLGK
jgi:hypothetical protein